MSEGAGDRVCGDTVSDTIIDDVGENAQISDSSSQTNPESEATQTNKAVEGNESFLQEPSEILKPKAPPPLSEDEQARFYKYEELFKNRFTEKDLPYIETEKQECATPPTVENWYVRPKRSFDWTSQRRGGDRPRDGPSRAYYAGMRDSPRGHQGGGNYHQHGGAGRGHYGGQRHQPYGGRPHDQHDRRSHDQYGRSHEEYRDKSHGQSHDGSRGRGHRNERHERSVNPPRDGQR